MAKTPLKTEIELRKWAMEQAIKYLAGRQLPDVAELVSIAGSIRKFLDQ